MLAQYCPRGLHGDGIEVEEGYVTTLAVPANLQARLGKFLLPFGKVNLTHRAELQMFDYPLVHREFFGEEGFSSTGVWGSWIGDPLGFYQELSIVGAEGMVAHEHGEESHGGSLADDLGDRLWLAHFKNSLDLTPASNLELGASWATSAWPLNLRKTSMKARRYVSYSARSWMVMLLMMYTGMSGSGGRR